MASPDTLLLRNRVPDPPTMGTHVMVDRPKKNRRLSRRQKRVLKAARHAKAIGRG